MNSTRTAAVVCVALATVGVAVATTTAGMSGRAGAVPAVHAAEANLIERFTVRLDARCQVAVLRIRLSRSLPVGIVIDGDGRVPLGRASASAVRAAASAVSDVKIWDLTLSNGTELGPGRHRVVLRALSADRSQVLDVSDAVEYTIPRSFAKAPLRCGVA